MIRNDRIILLAAAVVALLVLTAIFLLGTPSQIPPREKVQKRPYVPYAATQSQHNEEFYFDPNTADSTQLLKLGLQPWQVRNIYRYRAKGGIYRRKEDFARLYGLTVKDYRRLEPYIRISADYQPAASLFDPTPTKNTLSHNKGTLSSNKDTLSGNKGTLSNNKATLSPRNYPVKIKAGEHVALNLADTAQLRRVPGIGAYFAKEIARYGKRLGGYVSVDQLDEIDQFPKSAKQYFVIEQATPQKLNINQLSLEQVRRHP
jgi:DNA uptake protein ComE-like DNA-binding protein